MEYAICGETNPEGNRFCGQCGATLDAAAQRLRQQIMSVIERDFKDLELVAVTVADKAEDRLRRLRKILGIASSIAVIGLGANSAQIPNSKIQIRRHDTYFPLRNLRRSPSSAIGMLSTYMPQD